MSRRRARCARFILILLATCVLVISSAAHAANRRWNDAAPGDSFYTPGNWLGGVVPGVLDVAQFGRSPPPPGFQSFYTVSFAANVTNQALHIEDDVVTFDLNGRQYTVTTNNGIVIGNQFGGFSGQLTVLDGTVSSTTNIDVGAAAATPGVVDAENYAFWKSHFGDCLGSGSGATAGLSSSADTAVPEPSALFLMSLISLGRFVRQRRGGQAYRHYTLGGSHHLAQSQS
jgi:hypothetical protein